MNALKLNRLVNLLISDDTNALEQLFNEFYPRLYGFSKTLLKSEDGIDDVIQVVFIRIWENRKSIRNSQTFEAYIFTITHNLLLNELRRRINDKARLDFLYKQSVDSEFLLSEQIEFREMQEKIGMLIDRLPERQRNVYRLSRQDGLSHREIAERLGIAEKTVEYHIRESNLAIKNGLREFGLLAQLLFLHLFV